MTGQVRQIFQQCVEYEILRGIELPRDRFVIAHIAVRKLRPVIVHQIEAGGRVADIAFGDQMAQRVVARAVVEYDVRKPREDPVGELVDQRMSP